MASGVWHRLADGENMHRWLLGDNDDAAKA